jgi:hypothetical protein
MNTKMIKVSSASLFMPVVILAAAVCMTSSVQAAGHYLQGQEVGFYVGGESLSSLASGPGQQFGASKNSLTLPLEQKNRRSETFRSQFHLDITEFDWRGSTAAQKEYIWLSMPIQYQQQRGPKNLFLLDLEPGLMTDGGNIGMDHIGLNGSVIGRRLWDKGGFWQYGLTVDRAFGDYDVRPLFAMGWQASKRTWVELGFPNINVEHRLSNALQSYFMIKPAGGVWREEIKTDTVKQEASLQYRNWQVGIGANFHWREALWLNAEIGQLRNRRVRAYDDTAAAVKATPEQSRYWRIGASLKY